MNILGWIVFGGLAGWVATILTGENARFGIIGNIIIGIIGAYIGGWVAQKFFSAPGVTGFDLRSFAVAVIGAVILLFIVSLFK
jgi:uncharacterized membrane protein YeaQ/YmgE (transglycosylase-associated protein family)